MFSVIFIEFQKKYSSEVDSFKFTQKKIFLFRIEVIQVVWGWEKFEGSAVFY